MRKARKRLAVLIILIILLAFAAYEAPILYKNYCYPVKYEEYVINSSNEIGIDDKMLYAVIRTESRFNPEAESDVGARGLMQLMPDTFDWVRYRMHDERVISYDDMYNPEYNIEYGAYLLKTLYDEYGDYETALAAYHAGRGTVNSWLSDSAYSSDGKRLDRGIPSKATEHYVDKVMHAYGVYSDLYN